MFLDSWQGCQPILWNWYPVVRVSGPKYRTNSFHCFEIYFMFSWSHCLLCYLKLQSFVIDVQGCHGIMITVCIAEVVVSSWWTTSNAFLLGSLKEKRCCLPLSYRNETMVVWWWDWPHSDLPEWRGCRSFSQDSERSLWQAWSEAVSQVQEMVCGERCAWVPSVGAEGGNGCCQLSVL